MADMGTSRAFLTALFAAAVSAADPMRVLAAHLPDRPKGRLLIIGAGKASARMAEAVEAHYGPCEGYVITRYGYGRPCQSIEIVEAAHPVPDAAGETATRELLSRVQGLGPDDLVIALISGGGSALLCAPVEGVSLADKQALNSALLDSGAPISQMNAVRKHLSAVKGGKLAVACAPARLLSLLISDVPGDDPQMIASGPTVGDSTTSAAALAILERWKIAVPDHMRRAIAASKPILPDDPRLSKAETRIIAAPAHSLNAAAALAAEAGCDVTILGDDLEGEARALAAEHAKLAMDVAQSVTRPRLLLSGGECTVTRRGNGRGGPNAEYALAAALALNGHPQVHLIACDTDGVDGIEEVAGAYAGPDILAKAGAAGVSAKRALAENDAHSFFASCDSQIVPGPTLTNVNDFRAILILPKA
jgi:glycerate 2-kinase